MLSDWKRKKRPLVNQAEHQMHQLQEVLTVHVGQALAEQRFSASFQALSYHSQHGAAATPWFVDVDIDGKHTLHIQEYTGTVKMKMTITALFQTFSQFKDESTLCKIPLNSTASKKNYIIFSCLSVVCKDVYMCMGGRVNRCARKCVIMEAWI